MKNSEKIDYKMKVDMEKDMLRTGVKKYSDGTTYFGETDSQGLKSGKGKIQYFTNSFYHGSFRNGLRHGYGVFVYEGV